MALSHTRLDASSLSPAAQKALGAGPLKMMAARGLAPLPRPADLITVLYQLTLDDDAKIKEAAAKSAAELPDKVLTGALSDADVAPLVLDYFAGLTRTRPPLIELVILNRSTADETIAELAGALGEREIDLIAGNEARLLRHPDIIGAMYMNRAARMSTVDRAVELAVRNNVRVPGIPAWDEVVQALMGRGDKAPIAPEADAMFAAAARRATEDAEGGEGQPAEDIPISQMTIPMKIRLATLGNAFTRSELIRDANKMVALAAIKAPGVTEMEAIKYAANNSLCDDVIGYISRQREWTKAYNCKLALVGNPKTPLPVAMRFLLHLRQKDQRTISRSKSVPTALATQARKILMDKQKGGKI